MRILLDAIWSHDFVNIHGRNDVRNSITISRWNENNTCIQEKVKKLFLEYLIEGWILTTRVEKCLESV